MVAAKYLKSIATVLTKIFGNGELSLMRILSALVVTDIMLVWTCASLKSGKLEDVPWGTVAIFSTAFLCKAIQSFAEHGDRPRNIKEDI